MVERLQQRFHDFGPFRVDASRRLLLREGNPVPLTPKAFEILMALLRNADRVVDKDELMRQVWPGTVVEENNLTRNISSLRKALEEGPTDRRYIVTIPGRGYQFATQTPNLAPESQILFERHARTQVEVEEETHDAAALPKPGLKAMALSHIGLFIGVSALVLAGLAFATFYLSKRRVAPAPTKAAESIAVLPFDTASLDPDLEYLADGIIESTIDHLSRSSDLKVISFGSVLPYRSRLVSPQEIGLALGVRRIMISKLLSSMNG
jgi:DNA-binding winged helix-turn-helix (wHTH) protein